MRREYNRDYSNAICKYLTDHDWKYDFDEEIGVIKCSMSSKSKFQSYKLRFICRKDTFSLRIILPLTASEDVKMNIAEFITKANYRLIIGSFTMDFNDGEIGFEAYHCCADTIPTAEQIEQIMVTSVLTVEGHANAILMLLFGVTTVEQAIATTEEIFE